MTKRWPAALLLCLGLYPLCLSAATESRQIPGPDGEPVPGAGLFVAVDPSVEKRSVSGRVFDPGGTPLVEGWISILGTLEKVFGVPVTTRNWNTILAIVRILRT